MITREQLRKMVPNASNGNIDKFLRPLIETFEVFEINTPKRISAFIAQVSHESGSFYYVEEIADGSAYEYRKDLGNLDVNALAAAHAHHTTTGRFYKGHGLIQVTGYHNHKACGERLGIDTVNNPRLLCEPRYAALSAGWFWDYSNLNQYADSGVFGRITKIINGGTNGATERVKNYALCKKVLECDTNQNNNA